MYESESESHSVVSESSQPHGLHSPWGRKEQDTTERLSLRNSYINSFVHPAHNKKLTFAEELHWIVVEK